MSGRKSPAKRGRGRPAKPAAGSASKSPAKKRGRPATTKKSPAKKAAAKQQVKEEKSVFEEIEDDESESLYEPESDESSDDGDIIMNWMDAALIEEADEEEGEVPNVLLQPFVTTIGAIQVRVLFTHESAFEGSWRLPYPNPIMDLAQEIMLIHHLAEGMDEEDDEEEEESEEDKKPKKRARK